MGWERRRAGWFFYQARKVGGRVVKTYIGRGPLADVIALDEKQKRAERQRHQQASREQKAVLGRLDALAGDVAARATLLFRAAMLVAGLRRHRQGEWRRPRRGPCPTSHACGNCSSGPSGATRGR
jgi:hypothetical protein